MKPYYDEGGVTIYHGDCRKLLPTLTVDVIVADPPYGIALPTDYASRGRGVLAQCRDYAPVFDDDRPFSPAHLLEYKHIALWGANYFVHELPRGGSWLVWDKLRPDGIDQADAEFCWTNFVKGIRVFRHLWNGMMRASERGTGFHPTQKPVALMAWVIGKAPNGVVCDPYMGSGTTLVAARQLGRRAIGIEIEERYCEIAAKRLAQAALPLW